MTTFAQHPLFGRPPARDERIHIPVTTAEHDAARTLAAREGLTQSELVRRLLAERLAAVEAERTAA